MFTAKDLEATAEAGTFTTPPLVRGTWFPAPSLKYNSPLAPPLNKIEGSEAGGKSVAGVAVSSKPI